MPLRTLARDLTKAGRVAAGGRWAELRYQLRNRWRGVDFGHVSLDDLGLSPHGAHGHSSSGGPVLEGVFRTLEIPPGSVLLDLGSGKGGAALTLSPLGFAEVIGVELSGELIDVARRNAARLGRKNVRFVLADAAAFRDYDRVSHIFMYNPFPCDVVAHVVINLGASLARVPRRLTIVYRKPLCHELIMASGLFDAGDERRPAPDVHPWRVYRTRRP